MLSPSQIVKIFLPTLWIFSCFSNHGMNHSHLYREPFGNGDYFLDLYFRTNPKGVLQKENRKPVSFSGYFLNRDSQELISGQIVDYKGSRYYSFQSENGKFVGKVKGTDPCEPSMQFTIYQENLMLNSGTLKGAFCSKKLF